MVDIKKIILLLLLVPAVYANMDNYNNYNSILIDLNVSSTADSDVTGSNPRLDLVNISVLFFPRDNYMQKIISEKFYSDPSTNAKKSEDSIAFIWKNPEIKKYSFSTVYGINTFNSIIKVNNKIKFPLTNLEKELAKYTVPTEYIDVNDAIKRQAAEIAEGEDDYYKVVFKLADWVNKNINYSLNTLTEEVVEKSSWVLENKYGVCDELTNLFISMARSLGIPARFVTGTVYTNLGYAFQNHGWAEVYFPGYGWIPFDVTFAEYGWLDPSHVKLSDSFDSGSPSISYMWKSYNVNLNTNDLLIEAKVANATGSAEKIVDFRVKPIFEEVNFGSLVPVELNVKNLKPYYVAMTFKIKKAPGIYNGTTSKSIVLAPNEEKPLYWIFYAPVMEDKNYIYISEIEVIDNFNYAEESKVKYASIYDSYDLNSVTSLINSLAPEQKKELLSDVSITCNASKEYFYSDEMALVYCKIESTGNKILKDINICLLAECKKIDLSIAESRNIIFSYTFKTSGNYMAIAKHEDLEKYSKFYIKVIKKPIVILKIQNISEINYNEIKNMTLEIVTNAKINNLTLKLSKHDAASIDELEGRYVLTLQLKGKNLLKEMPIDLKYKDEVGKYYFLSNSIDIKVINIPWYRRFFMLE